MSLMTGSEWVLLACGWTIGFACGAMVAMIIQNLGGRAWRRSTVAGLGAVSAEHLQNLRVEDNKNP